MEEAQEHAAAAGGKWKRDECERGVGDVTREECEPDQDEDACKPSQEEMREEAGCVLWDLAANESQAEFLVRFDDLNL